RLVHHGQELFHFPARVLQPLVATAAQGRVLVLIELSFPLIEQGLGDAINLFDSLTHFSRALFALLVGVPQPFIAIFKLSTVVSRDRLEFLQCVAKLFLRGLLTLFGSLYSGGKQVTLLYSDFLQHGVVRLLATHTT